jgi:ferredoxin
MQENTDKHAMSNIVVQRLEAVLSEGAVRELSLCGQFAENKTACKEAPESILLQRMLLMSPEERKSFWDEQFKKCVKCYGCIDICPVYEDRPDNFNLSEDVPRGVTPPPYPLFHLLRGYNVWDTCVVCGECERTCPAGIPLKTLQDMIVLLPPEQVFAMVPGLEDEYKTKILSLVEGRKGRIGNAA